MLDWLLALGAAALLVCFVVLTAYLAVGLLLYG